MPPADRDTAKQAAAEAAVAAHVRGGMVLGLGSGSTAGRVVQVLGALVRGGLDVRGVASSAATRAAAVAAGVPLVDLDAAGPLDLTLDGADEIDGQGRMIKGGGGCLLWEKIVARASRRMVAVVDDAKCVERLGRYPLAIEVVPFGWRSTARALAALLAQQGFSAAPLERRGGGEPFVTDSGNYILDGRLGPIADPARLALALNQVPGVVEHGLFVGVAQSMVVGHADGRADLVPFPADDARC